MKIDLSIKTSNQLRSNLNLITVIIVALIIVISFLIGISIYGSTTREDSNSFIATLVVGISCLGTVPLQFIIRGAIKKELKSRGEIV